MYFFRLFTLCSVRVSVLVIVLMTVHVKESKIGDLSDFEGGQIVGAHLAGSSVTKTATLLGVSRATVSKVTSACMNHGKTTSAKRNSGRKSTLTERGSRILGRNVSKN
jgi:hypothetical protein